MITAYAVMRDDHAPPALIQDRARAELYAADHHGTVHELVEKAAILRKFDAYVPADQASSLRYRVAELEAQVEALQEELARYVLPAAAVVITSPAAIEAAFERDDAAG
jgi:cell division protein FtsB